MTLAPVTMNPELRSSSVLVIVTGGRIPASTYQFVEGVCHIVEPVILNVVAFRVHTHATGLSVTGYKVSKDKQWSLIGRRSPKMPQSYNLLEKPLTLEQGDSVAVRCIHNNTQDHAIAIGCVF